MDTVKSLFLIVSILLTPVLARTADAYSTGTYTFTFPSTSTADRNKSWATKYNDDFQIAGTALSNLNTRINNVATDTTTIYNQLTATAVTVSNLEVSYSTGKLHVSNTNYVELSGSTQTKIGGLVINGGITGSSLTVGIGGFEISGASISFVDPDGAGSFTTLQIRRGLNSSNDVASGNLTIGNDGNESGAVALKNLNGSLILRSASGSGVKLVSVNGVNIQSPLTIENINFENYMATVAAGIAEAGPASAIVGSTRTITFKVSSAFISTISVCGIPMACHTWGPSTATIVGMWADAYAGSTVGWTRVDLIISTGGVNGLPLAPSRFNPLSISTASSLGLASYSGFVSTAAKINPGEWIGVAITSMSVSGRVSQGIALHIDYFEHGRY